MTNRNHIIFNENNIFLNIYKEDDEAIDYPEEDHLRLDILNAFIQSGLNNPFAIVREADPIMMVKLLFTQKYDHSSEEVKAQLYVTLHNYGVKVRPGINQDEVNTIFQKHVLDALIGTKIKRIRQGMLNVLEFEEPAEFLANLNKFLMNVAK